MQTVICLKWEDRYGPEYVNRLYNMVRRNTARKLRFICITDDPTGINPGVETMEMPVFDLPEEMRRHPFRRMFLFKKKLGDLHGDVLHLDLDILVTGSIDPLFDAMPDSRFIVAENWTQKNQGIGNMSVFRFKVGVVSEIWDRFVADPIAMKRRYRNSQTFVCRTLGRVDFFPERWCLSFKHSLVSKWPMNIWTKPVLPDDAIVIAFTGKPDIEEAARGEWPVTSSWKKIYKQIRPSPWILDHWR